MGRFLFALAPLLAFAANPLDTSRLEAIHAQRVEWMKRRVAAPLPGVYEDFRAVSAPGASAATVKAARAAGVRVLFVPGGDLKLHDGILFAPPPAELPQFRDRRGTAIADTREALKKFKLFPDEVFGLTGVEGNEAVRFQNESAHILARELNAGAIEESLERGRAYAAYDWLCDPAGFYFIAQNNLGVFDMGDSAPMLKGTRLVVNLPVPAKVKIMHDGAAVAESDGVSFSYQVKAEGSYWLDAALPLAGEDRSWIHTNPIHVAKPPALSLPAGEVAPEVEVRKDIEYVDDGIAKHKLDVYLPKGKKNFPVMVFYHGGSWRSGDRSMYTLFGSRFAKAGIGVVVPSYRLMPQSPHPAQIEDAAAAFAWVMKNIAQMGGDISRVYAAGHSAGGHLAALLALDSSWLAKYGVAASSIRGVIAMSGVYDVSHVAGFKDASASPIEFVRGAAPPFLITYCQWDYLGLPLQAREFAAALKSKFDSARLVYIPGESHISEIVSALKDGDPTARAILDFVK